MAPSHFQTPAAWQPTPGDESSGGTASPQGEAGANIPIPPFSQSFPQSGTYPQQAHPHFHYPLAFPRQLSGSVRPSAPSHHAYNHGISDLYLWYPRNQQSTTAGPVQPLQGPSFCRLQPQFYTAPHFYDQSRADPSRHPEVRPRLHPSANLLHSPPENLVYQQPPDQVRPSIQEWPTYNLRVDAISQKRQGKRQQKADVGLSQQHRTEQAFSGRANMTYAFSSSPKNRAKRKAGIDDLQAPTAAPPLRHAVPGSTTAPAHYLGNSLRYHGVHQHFTSSYSRSHPPAPQLQPPFNDFQNAFQANEDEVTRLRNVEHRLAAENKIFSNSQPFTYSTIQSEYGQNQVRHSSAGPTHYGAMFGPRHNPHTAQPLLLQQHRQRPQASQPPTLLPQQNSYVAQMQPSHHRRQKTLLSKLPELLPQRHGDVSRSSPQPPEMPQLPQFNSHEAQLLTSQRHQRKNQTPQVPESLPQRQDDVSQSPPQPPEVQSPPKPRCWEDEYQPIVTSYENYRWPVQLYELRPDTKFDFAQSYLDHWFEQNVLSSTTYQWHSHISTGFIQGGNRFSMVVLHNAANPFEWGSPAETTTSVAVYGRFAHTHEEIRWTTVTPWILNFFKFCSDVTVKEIWTFDMPKATDRRFHRAYWLAANMLPLGNLLNHCLIDEKPYDALEEEDTEEPQFQISKEDLQCRWSGDQLPEEYCKKVWQRIIDDIEHIPMHQLGYEHVAIGGSERVYEVDD